VYDIEKIIKEEQLTHEDLSYAIYSDACIRAATDTSAFNSFKTNPNYIYELEHTSKELGENYISQAKEEFHKELMELNWEKVQVNDKFGGAQKIPYESLSIYTNHIAYSPTTIGYLYLALRMCRELQTKNIKKPIDVVELGAGYGGQCYLFLVVAELMAIPLKSYGLADLYHANLLQNKYLEHIISYINKDNKLSLKDNTQLEFYSCKDYGEYSTQVGNIDYVISNYALSEMSVNWAKRYLETFIKKSKYGFFQFNTLNKGVQSNGTYENLREADLATHYTDIQNLEDPGNTTGVPGGGFAGNRLLICEVKS
jgi:hypothetical protein|tara:strand:- start:1669 stop:2604 length:936 start_codon:yes stop_codon:yes gene_type:complete